MTGELRPRIVLLGTSFAIASPDERWVELLRELWRPLLSSPGDVAPVQHVVEVSPMDDASGWNAFVDGRLVVATVDDPWFMAAQIRYEMVRAALDAADAPLLHAAALTRDDASIVLVGASGTGKTTLALALEERGWRHLSDDLCVVEPDGSITAVPVPLAIKSPSLWERAGQTGEWAPPPKTVWLTPGRGTGVTTIQAPHVVFPRFDPAAAAIAEGLSAGAAVMRLAEHVDPVGRGELPRLRALAERARSLAIRYGSSGEALEFMGRFSQKWGE